MFTRIAFFLSFCLLCASAAAQAEFVPPHIAMPGNGIKAHYVHLHGNAWIESFSDQANEVVANAAQCTNWREVMPKDSTVVDLYVYAAQDRSIMVEHVEVYQVGADCKPHKTIDRTKSHIRTAGSYCTLMHQQKTAVGPCDLSAPARWDIDKPAIKQASAGKKAVKGVECTVYPSPLPNGFDVCVADGGNFHAFPSYMAPMYVRGVPVEYTYQNKVNSQASEIKFDMDVNPELFAVPKDFTIKGKPASGGRR
jgi:hypothetical protein